MRIIRLVITGGPCGGKSGGILMLEKELTKKGYKVIIVPEIATELDSCGIHKKDYSAYEFQEIVIDRSLAKERETIKKAKELKQDVVILYDRGILDGKAYIEEDLFQELLKKKNLNEIKEINKYDGVFHLITTANGAEEYYTLENNKARSEGIEEARQLDIATRNAWVGHPHLRIIDNSTSFELKIKRLLNEVLSTIGLPVPIEIENKYLIKIPNFNKIIDKVEIQILQTYLYSEDDSVERRIRQIGNGEDGEAFVYYYTEKRNLSSKIRIKKEKKISEKEYLSLLMEGKKCIRKNRICFVYENQYFELDIYPNWKEQAILEIELTEETQEPNIPSWIKVVREVTGDETFSNYNLAK